MFLRRKYAKHIDGNDIIISDKNRTNLSHFTYYRFKR